MIAILVAVKQELNPILRRAVAHDVVRQAHLDFHEGTLAGQPIALLALGIGRECARIAAEMTFRCYRPDLIISAGFGGGLASTVQNGDIIIGNEILELTEDAGDRIQTRPVEIPLRVPDIPLTGLPMRVHFGKLLTTDEMVLRADAKQRLGAATGALSVDMETSAVARVAAERGIPMVAIRCISDNSHENLPEQFNDFFVLGQLQPGRVISVCLGHPRVIAGLARLGYRAYTSGRNLAQFIELMIPRLAANP